MIKVNSVNMEMKEKNFVIAAAKLLRAVLTCAHFSRILCNEF